MSRTLRQQFERVRAASEQNCASLSLEDYSLQAMPDTSPPKWHLAHSSWFFETFILKAYAADYAPFDQAFERLFNSYYNGIGEQHPRAERGLLSRPELARVLAYREHVNVHIKALLADPEHAQYEQFCDLVELGLHHEQQHQELFFTDIKYSLSRNPLLPALHAEPLLDTAPQRPLAWREYPGGTVSVGHCTGGFCFDNELPAHQVLLQPYALADRLVSAGEFLNFIDDAGYRRPELWLADGWSTVCERGWQQPLYWLPRADGWYEYTLHGVRPLQLSSPVAHISGYEADAYARWADARLPSEFEWEAAAPAHDPAVGTARFIEAGVLHPQAPRLAEDTQMHGGLWEWTASAYGPYPGYRVATDAIGEYNGKFMANQLVLRGGSCVTPAAHFRNSYRNFFYPPDRWQFTGIRLARWP